MEYIVIEVQANADGTIGTLVYTYADKNTAEQQYHTILAAAAVSSVENHGAVMLTKTGGFIKNDSFNHATETNSDSE